MPAPLARDRIWPSSSFHSRDEGIQDGEDAGEKAWPEVRRPASEDAAAVIAAEPLDKERLRKSFEISSNAAMSPDTEAKTRTAGADPVVRSTGIGYLIETDVLRADHRCREARRASTALRASPFLALRLSIEPYLERFRKARYCRWKVQRSEGKGGVQDPRDRGTSHL